MMPHVAQICHVSITMNSSSSTRTNPSIRCSSTVPSRGDVRGGLVHERAERPTPTRRIPPPPPSTPLILFAKWEAYGNASKAVRTSRKDLKHLYKLAVQPDEPIAVGRRVRILAVSPIAYCVPGTPLGQYDTYDPHIVGTVEEMWRAENGAVRAKVKNACKANTVREVEVELPHKTTKCREDWGTGLRDREADNGDFIDGGDQTLTPMACIRPMPTRRECLGNICWNLKHSQ